MENLTPRSWRRGRACSRALALDLSGLKRRSRTHNTTTRPWRLEFYFGLWRGLDRHLRASFFALFLFLAPWSPTNILSKNQRASFVMKGFEDSSEAVLLVAPIRTEGAKTDGGVGFVGVLYWLGCTHLAYLRRTSERVRIRAPKPSPRPSHKHKPSFMPVRTPTKEEKEKKRRNWYVNVSMCTCRPTPSRALLS